MIFNDTTLSALDPVPEKPTQAHTRPLSESQYLTGEPCTCDVDDGIRGEKGKMFDTIMIFGFPMVAAFLDIVFELSPFRVQTHRRILRGAAIFNLCLGIPVFIAATMFLFPALRGHIYEALPKSNPVLAKQIQESPAFKLIEGGMAFSDLLVSRWFIVLPVFAFSMYLANKIIMRAYPPGSTPLSRERPPPPDGPRPPEISPFYFQPPFQNFLFGLSVLVLFSSLFYICLSTWLMLEYL